LIPRLPLLSGAGGWGCGLRSVHDSPSLPDLPPHALPWPGCSPAGDVRRGPSMGCRETPCLLSASPARLGSPQAAALQGTSDVVPPWAAGNPRPRLGAPPPAPPPQTRALTRLFLTVFSCLLTASAAFCPFLNTFSQRCRWGC